MKKDDIIVGNWYLTQEFDLIRCNELYLDEEDGAWTLVSIPEEAYYRTGESFQYKAVWTVGYMMHDYGKVKPLGDEIKDLALEHYI